MAFESCFHADFPTFSSVHFRDEYLSSHMSESKQASVATAGIGNIYEPNGRDSPDPPDSPERDEPAMTRTLTTQNSQALKRSCIFWTEMCRTANLRQKLSALSSEACLKMLTPLA
jgi:hypothetical protein